ncbi:thiol:disulfide interchange protein DsbA/DsbL [Nitrosomonas europaea]|uniref:thiol:disulfide interchange protein DsbA/DsbL n=1 Tax=Nitrosomonas europaea TaxID=915 RepID=UPI002491F58F|nr:thiol:disulfide interchange protein DsbA/DsbL [Nitrosomonas europaea]HRN81586.1 thiol:disulfide interchange protein DsbA/DsbL [Nitrosomonas europaea]HRQ08209.1 thiol:disulfide interchange protein DsbA/DsbL [Nitrosomonas europaea]
MTARKMICFLLSFIVVNLAGVLIAHAEIVEGRDYTVLSAPQPTEGDSEHIEVIEFFWYGCPHCSDLHPHLSRWLENKPADVAFRFVPAILRNNWVPGAKTFYAMESLGLTQTLHDKVYHAIHREKTDLSKEATLFDWIGKQGVDRDKFIGAYNSFTVQNQANRSAQMIRQYKLTGVPALVVDGRYLTSGKAGGTPQDTISVLNQLIEKVREEKKSR